METTEDNNNIINNVTTCLINNITADVNDVESMETNNQFNDVKAVEPLDKNNGEIKIFLN